MPLNHPEEIIRTTQKFEITSVSLFPQNGIHGDRTTGNESHTDTKLTNCEESGPNGTACI
jgi:hypothetical protein